METKVTLKSLLEKGRVFAPCIWDCMSAKAAEMSGFKAALLSSGCMSFSMLACRIWDCSRWTTCS